MWSAGSNPAGRAQCAGSVMQRFYNYMYMYMCTTARVLRGESRFKPAVDRVLVCRDFTYLYFTPCPGERSSNIYIYFVITSPGYYKIFFIFV